MEEPIRTYVLYTEHNKEEHLAEVLTSTVKREYPEAVERIYVPKVVRMWHQKDENGRKNWTEKEVPLFYNYVFIESRDITAFSRILRTLRIETSYHMVGRNRTEEKETGIEEYPIIPVSDSDMERLAGLLGTGGIVGRSTYIKEGSHVEFRSGPLKGREAEVKKINPSKRYAIMEMDFLGEKRNISVAVEMLSGNADPTSN